MELDMFLTKKLVIKSKVKEEDVGYWRKANHIHRWFVENVQNGVDECQETLVSYEKLEELLDICKKVRDNHKLARKLLPTRDGFFFGNTEYDTYYFSDINDTIDILEKVLADKDESGKYKGKIYYQSCW